MLRNRAFLSVPSVLRTEGIRHIPASSVAASRIVRSMRPCWDNSFHSPHTRSLKTATGVANLTSKHQHTISPLPLSNRRSFSTHNICDHIDCSISKNLSVEEFDEAYKFVYQQHNHPRGPWLKTLQTAQKVLSGDSPRILVIGSGPGEPAATLASNFQDAEVISAHSTKKCVDWASERFNKNGLHNATARLIPSMENLDMFADGTFDLVTSCYGIANTQNPQASLDEIHRVLKPGGSFLCSVWENAPADPASDIILRHSCVGPNPWHKNEDNVDVVGDYACPVRSKRPMSLSKPHLLENMLEKAKLPVFEVLYDEYPLKLGTTKDFAFKALTLPIRAELQELIKNNHYHYADAAEAFEDVLKEGFMVKQHEDGEMEVPYNVYKFVVSRRQYEDGDMTKERKAHQRSSGAGPASVTKRVIHPFDVKEDPVIFETWNRMKGAASEKIVNAVKKQVGNYQHDDTVRVLDAAPTPFAPTAINIAATHPYASVVATSKSVNVVEGIREEVVKHGLSNMKVRALDSSHMTTFEDKSFDVIVCGFGLGFLNSPTDTLSEFHRLLKPGGSLVVAVWEDFSLQHLADYIVEQMHAGGNLEDFFEMDKSTPDVLGQLTPFAKPRDLENLVTKSQFKVTHVDHETARILLSEANCKAEYGLDVATLPIRPFLQELQESGENRTAFEDAKKAFESLLKDPSLVSRDNSGNLVTTLPSRFKIVTAIRQFEDSDGFLKSESNASTKSQGRKGIKYSDIPK